MLSFESDYIEGAHERILQRLIETNYEKLPGYGNDRYCQSAAEKIKAACACPQAEVRFIVGGTQTNQLIISSMLSEGDGVIAAETGHIAAHEAGAVEFTGHKVLTLPHKEGKLSSQDLLRFLTTYYGDENHEHMVYPGMVYLSHPTEYGTLYTKNELVAIAEVCREYRIPLFLDGARLGYGLMSYGTDLSLPDIAELTDVFYIGGTKVGALCGEAVVFTKNNLPPRFVASIKRHGALLAKGRLLGIQFDTLFTDDLYFTISRHAIDMAEKLRALFIRKGYSFYIPTVTNQIFVVLENGKMAKLREKVAFSFWEKLDEDHTVVRFATDWATTDEDIGALARLL